MLGNRRGERPGSRMLGQRSDDLHSRCRKCAGGDRQPASLVHDQLTIAIHINLMACHLKALAAIAHSGLVTSARRQALVAPGLIRFACVAISHGLDGISGKSI